MYSPIEDVPYVIWLHIFSNLPALTILSCTSVSRQFQKIATDESLWKGIISSLGWRLVLLCIIRTNITE
jgi:hypothetical protein